MPRGLLGAVCWMVLSSSALAEEATVEPRAKLAPPVDSVPLDAPSPGSVPGTVFLEDSVNANAPIRSRLSLRHDFGESVGIRRGFSYLEGFVPLWQRSGRILFNNLRVVNFDDRDLWEFNGGFGVRRYNERTNRILGVHGHYDGRTTQTGNFFHQATVGFESLGCRLDVRGNVYLPVGNDRQQVLDTGFFNPRFSGFNVLLDRTRINVVALRGYDLEVGTPVPGLSRWDVRAFLGCYHYSADGVQSIDGIRGRLEANPNERLSLYFSVQNDAVFDTTVHGGFAFHFGPGRRTRSLPGGGMQQRLGDRVVRDPNIMLRNSVETTSTVATDAATGQPLQVKHVNSNAAGGGDGTVERPFQTLGQLEKGSSVKDILFAHGGSVFLDQFIKLQNGQRFLGEGLPHLITTAQGAFLLPRATGDNSLPVMRYSTVGPLALAFLQKDAITLASDTEAAGFVIDSAPGNAFYGESIQNVLIRNNTIRDAFGAGIYLSDVTGNVSIENNTIVNSYFEGIFVELYGGSMNLLARNNVILNSQSCQFILDVGGDAQINAAIQGNTFEGGQCISDIGIAVFGTAKGNFVISSNTHRNGALDAIELFTDESAQVTARITDNQLQTPGLLGIYVAAYGDSKATVQVARNRVIDATFLSIVGECDDNSFLGMQILGNVVDRDIELVTFSPSTFILEDTLNTNVLLGGAATNVDAGIAIVPFGTLPF